MDGFSEDSLHWDSGGRGSGWGPARNSWRASRLGGVRECPSGVVSSLGKDGGLHVDAGFTCHLNADVSPPPTGVVKSSTIGEPVPRAPCRLPIGPEAKGASLRGPRRWRVTGKWEL